jgi:hypothetical protein
MTNSYNIADTDCNILVPVLSDTGSLMAYLMYTDPTKILREHYCGMTTPRQYSDNIQTILREPDNDLTSIPCGILYNNNAFGCTGQPIIHRLKTKKMAKSTSTNGVSADRIKNDPVFERTRENNAEFSRAGKAAKLLRSIFRNVTINAKDRVTHARLVKVAFRIILADPISERGKRTVNNGDLQQLLGFDFNERSGIKDVLYVTCPVSFNRVSGEVTVNIPAFVPGNNVQFAKGTTHVRIVAAAAAINFDTAQHEFAMQETPELPYNGDPTQAATLTMALPANSKDTVVVTLGIEYYQKVNSRMYALKAGVHNATSIVLVDKVS